MILMSFMSQIASRLRSGNAVRAGALPARGRGAPLVSFREDGCEVSMNRDGLAEFLACRVSGHPGLHWLRPCHVFLFAYRPSWFSQPRKGMGPGRDRPWWGPAYSHRVIRKRGASGRLEVPDSGGPATAAGDGRHWRRLSVPNPALAAIQREILGLIRQDDPTGDAENAFPSQIHGVRGRNRGPMLNAWAHVGASRLLRLDIENFFGSVRRARVAALLEDLEPAIRPVPSDALDRSAVGMIARLCTHGGSLPQGACTSPLIANLFFKPVDEELISFAHASQLTYTRYFDDLCFSVRSGELAAPGRLQSVVMIRVLEALRDTGLKINLSKTREGSGREFQITGFEIHRDRLRLSPRGRRWIRGLGQAAGSNETDPLASAIRLWRDERSIEKVLPEVGSLVDRWFEVLDRVKADVGVVGRPESDSAEGAGEGMELAASLLAALESRRNDVSEPEVHRDGVISWRLIGSDGGSRQVAVTDPRGRLATLLLSDRSVCDARSVAGFLDHLQGLRAACVLETNGRRVGAVQDDESIQRLLDEILDRVPPGDARIWTSASGDEPISGRSLLLEELGSLDNTLRNVARLRKVTLPRMPSRQIIEGGVGLQQWACSLADCLRAIGCDRPIDASPTDGDSLWRSGIVLTIRLADWSQRRRRGLYDWDQLQPEVRRGMRPKDLENVTNLSVAHAGFWQRRLCAKVSLELQRWIEFLERTPEAQAAMTFDLAPSVDRLIAELRRLVDDGLLDPSDELDGWRREELPRIWATGSGDPWRSILELASVLARGVIEAQGPRRTASLRILGEKLRGSEGAGREDDVEKMIFRRSLRCGAGMERVELGTIIWHLRNLNSHGRPSRREDERSQAWKQVNRLMRSIGRRHPDDWEESRAGSRQLRTSFQLEPVERMEILRVILEGLVDATREFDECDYERDVQVWVPEPRNRRRVASDRPRTGLQRRIGEAGRS